MASLTIKGQLESAEQRAKLFQALLGASADGILITDASQSILAVNQAFCGYFGASLEEVAGSSLHPWLRQLDGDAPQEWADLEKQLRQAGTWEDVHLQRTTEEGVRYLSVRLSLAESVVEGQSRAIISLWRDVTAQRVEEGALTEADGYDGCPDGPLEASVWETSIHDLLDGTVEEDVETSTKEGNAATPDSTEPRQAEATLRAMNHQLAKRMRELNCLYGLSRLASQSDRSLEEFFLGVVDLLPLAWRYPEITCGRLRFDGKEYASRGFKKSRWKQWQHISAFGKIAGTLEVFYTEERPRLDEGPFLKEERQLLDALARQVGEICERKRVEGALRESEEKLRTIFECIGDGVAVTDAFGNIGEANEALAGMHGYEDREEILGRNVLELIADEDRNRVQEGIVSIVVGGPP
jgi:PAS domain S-box-containing protein